jgi:hypothetical protein
MPSPELSESLLRLSSPDIASLPRLASTAHVEEESRLTNNNRSPGEINVGSFKALYRERSNEAKAEAAAAGVSA